MRLTPRRVDHTPQRLPSSASFSSSLPQKTYRSRTGCVCARLPEQTGFHKAPSRTALTSLSEAWFGFNPCRCASLPFTLIHPLQQLIHRSATAGHPSGERRRANCRPKSRPRRKSGFSFPPQPDLPHLPLLYGALLHRA
ncbi:hypothetical protein AAFF_G00125290 [Aldrovandia affinis]|uniref:Uncharacterized protein n=1 Tax=Aldrovandia affinis TaxID=143900 RepID=A0AAD7RRU5_9TELE|nr:hypothetical protein AAFF_G00125290 [Aldrovandia affinis]